MEERHCSGGHPGELVVSYVDAGRYDAGTAYVAFDRHTFGDMAPMLYKTTDYGSHWQALANAAQPKGIQGFAYVLREDPVRRGLLYAGTELGLWISPDDGASWAQFKGGDFPAVSVRDLVVQPRDGDLVLATHGRGIWIIDDLAPLRSLTPALLQQEAVFLPTRQQQQRISTNGGWAEGDASYAGSNASNDVTVTYYQKARHLFGPLKLEVLDAKGTVLDTLPAGKRRGINRVAWPMNVKPPLVPPAASIAGSATQGPRVPPGTYTVRMTKGDHVYEDKINVGLDPRSPFNAADRQAQFDATMKVHAMFGRMSDLVARIQAVRGAAGAIAGKLPEADPLRTQLTALSSKADVIRKQIVATKEGGAITGEERLREHMDQLYGGLMSYEGKPADTLIAYSSALERELGDVEGDFGKLRDGDLAAANAALKAKGLPAIELPEHAPVAWRYSGDPDTRAAQERD